MANTSIDLSGKVFGRLTVLKRIGSRHNKSLWLCGCRCGNFTEVISICLTRGKAKNNRVGGTKSCGYCNDASKYPKEYNAWKDLNARCTVETHKAFKYYGGRGITVHVDWKQDFFNFLEDVGLCPDSSYSLDRIDNDGNYTYGNCRWTDWSTQMSNRRKGR